MTDFQNMSFSELRAYVLEHREDEAALSALVDRQQTHPDRQTYPAPATPADFAEMGRIIEQLAQRRRSLE